jgi:hypothetical protein
MARPSTRLRSRYACQGLSGMIHIFRFFQKLLAVRLKGTYIQNMSIIIPQVQQVFRMSIFVVDRDIVHLYFVLVDAFCVGYGPRMGPFWE